MADEITQPGLQQSTAKRPGWKTTEAWLAFAGLAVLSVLAEQLIQLLPALALQPGVPHWLTVAIPIALVGLAAAQGWIVKAYAAARTSLKLGLTSKLATDSDAAARVNGLGP